MDDVEADQCSGCGSQLSVTLRKPGKPFPRWDINTVVCSKCEATAAIQHRFSKVQQERAEKGAEPLGGRLWTANRVYPDAIPL